MKAMQKYLPESSPATDKGHMKRQKQGIRSTKEKIMTALSTIETARDINPPMEKRNEESDFCLPCCTRTKAGNTLRQLHRQPPHPLHERQHSYFRTLLLVFQRHPCHTSKKIKNKTTVAAFKRNIKYLKKRNFKPVFNIIDNVATKAVKSYLQDEGIKMQLIKPHDHHPYSAEQAIQTFKNHTIAGLCTCDEDFPSVLWCKVIKQAQDTLNMLCTLRVHPKLSAYHVLEGPHDLIAPPLPHLAYAPQL